MTAAIRASVVAFDAYGTVFDLASAVRRHADVVGPGAATLAQTWRQKQLEYTWVRTLAGRVVPFWDVTVAALDYALATVPHVNPMARDALLDAYRSLDAYADAVDAIDGVVARGMRVAILSNGDPSMVAEAVRGAGLEGRFHAVVSVAGTGAFKVDPRAYRPVLQRFGIVADEACLVSGNRWDVAGARAAGLSAIWVNRDGLPDEYPDLAPNATVRSLREVASHLAAMPSRSDGAT